MYSRSARFYDDMYAFKDYQAAAEHLRLIIQQHAPAARTLLDVACGTGRHLEHLRSHYTVEGIDINPELLTIAASRNPQVPLHQGDMRNFELGRAFDVVTCLFSSIAYGRTSDSLRHTVERLVRHTSESGIVIVEPFFSPRNFRDNDLVLNTAKSEASAIAWMYKTRREGNLGVVDIHHLVGTQEGIEYFVERHEFGLFEHEEYLVAFSDAGMTAEYDPLGPFGRGLFVARRTQA